MNQALQRAGAAISTFGRSIGVCSAGVFGFAVEEFDFGLAGGAVGAIGEAGIGATNGKSLQKPAELYEGWVGGEGPVGGVAVVRDRESGNLTAYGIIGEGVSAGPLAGAKGGYVQPS